MEVKIELIASGGITSPDGFYAGAAYAGIKKKEDNVLDLAILRSQSPCVAAALFTTNRIKAAPIVLSQQRVPSKKVAAVVANSGCANAFTGEGGLADAAEMARLAAENIGASAEQVLVASTGVIGQRLPMELIKAGMGRIATSRGGGGEMARAIMTTDTVPKEVAMAVSVGDMEFVIGGVAKGSGMIHPDMATLLCFLTTDAAVDMNFLEYALREAADISLLTEWQAISPFRRVVRKLISFSKPLTWSVYR